MACRKPGADRKLVAGAPSAAAEYRGLSCHPFNDLLFCFQRGSAQLWTVLRENLYASPARVNWDPWREPQRSLISIVVLLAGSGPFGESVGPVAISRGSWQKGPGAERSNSPYWLSTPGCRLNIGLSWWYNDF